MSTTAQQSKKANPMYLKFSDVVGDPTPQNLRGDVPESLIPKPDLTPKSRTRTNPDIKFYL